MTISKRIRSSVAMLGLVALAMLAGDREVTAAQAARMELRKIADNVYVMQHPTGSSNSTGSDPVGTLCTVLCLRRPFRRHGGFASGRTGSYPRRATSSRR